MTPDELAELALAESQAQAQFSHRVYVCTGTGCISANSDQVKEALVEEVKARGLERACRVTGGGCRGFCAAGPLVSVEPGDLLYQGVKPADATAILDGLAAGRPVETLSLDLSLPFFSRQLRVVLNHSGKIDPERIEDYLASGGYGSFLKALTSMRPLEVIEQVTRSGLRGRGGAGYPTGLKWSTTARAVNTPKYVVCNGDEGDPGAFMDRSVMEGSPHRVLEGLMIAAYAVGAEKGYIYLRAEYPIAVKRLQLAIRQAQKLGLLGSNIGGTPFSFQVELRLGAGAFVCGEETALLASIEGRRGTPRPRPPYPAEHGLWGLPTLINNVETIANVPPIIARGGEWFASMGAEKSKGTKVFALSGQVKNTGLIEVPMGMTLREIIFEVGGGIPEGRRFKAVQTGGPSGGCIPEAFLDMPVDFESLAKVGSFMGSGGMVVMDETSCMVDIAKFFMEFSMAESCGKCVPCRVGTAQMSDLLQKIVTGQATLAHLEQLETLCDLVKNTSLCGLGQSAPNPVQSTLRYFRDEYLAHIVAKTCPAGVCPVHQSRGEETLSAA